MTAYCPSRIYRNGHVNTIAAATLLRKVYAQRISHSLYKNSKSIVLHLADDIRLQGFLNTHVNNKKRPLVMIIHGWLGCANSLYLLPISSRLYQEGFNVFRLNLRDHGGTQHLNQDLFHSCRLNEVLNATQEIQSQVAHSDFFLIGYSLGGNFALRIGADAECNNLKISKIFSICPVMNPNNALDETQTMPSIYTQYYLRRWKYMLKKKHLLYPDFYDLQVINRQKSLTEMTEHLLLQYTDFDSVQSYLNGYSITGDRLKSLMIPSEIYVSKDDPVIPFTDYEELYPNENLNIHITENGGHCGYLKGLFELNWIDEQIMQHLDPISV